MRRHFGMLGAFGIAAAIMSLPGVAALVPQPPKITARQRRKATRSRKRGFVHALHARQGDREKARRRRQIERAQLTLANGLVG